VHAAAARPTPSLVRRVKTAAIAVPVVVLPVGAVAGIGHPVLTLVAAAVVFGWSQLAGA
jgi:hypothetical protein